MSGIALKLTSLLVRTLAKPLASTIKAQAKEHPPFRKLCISFAQRLHRTDVRLRLGLTDASRTTKDIKVRPLNDTKAIENGANFLSEAFIFSVAGGLILYESFRSKRKDKERRETVADDISTLQDEIEWLKTKLKEQKIVMDEYTVPPNMKPSVLKVDVDRKPIKAARVDNADTSHQNQENPILSTKASSSEAEKPKITKVSISELNTTGIDAANLEKKKSTN
ncbi:OPA3-domain-containing protein [Nadsonia fulvescens var. elongata DSM 6958]|uniref:OPA3-domain-containing protein n=1 Tax=Nadsonia fulvescens var. elongata DSM 6958 TaxID=857566 RepID=A0A1E3PR48_9ASCO|nr:OPA3-domain-containing protein [Nadsonia fulvescens var. elongata DSM 6958]